MKINFLLPCLILLCNISSAQNRIAIFGSFQGDNAFTVEAFSSFSTMTGYQTTRFIITNKTGDDVDVKFEVAITYTCGRVQKNSVNYYISGMERITSSDWLKETTDKECIKTEVDGTKNTIVGVSYLGLVTKNHSMDKRKAKQQWQATLGNVQKYLKQKNYIGAKTALDKANELDLDANDRQALQDWYRKVDLAQQEEENRKEMVASKIEQNTVKSSKTNDFWDSADGNSSNKSNVSRPSKTETAQEKKTREAQQAIERTNKVLAENEKNRQETERKVNQWSNNLNTTFYAAQAASEGYQKMEQNSKLSGNYRTVEELEADFNQRYNALSQDAQNWKQAADEATREGTNLLFNDGTVSGQATAEFVGTVASLFNSSEREERERKEALERQREKALEELNRKKWNAIIDLRQKIFEQFTDGGTPLSKHGIQTPEVYCFVYSFNTADKDETKPNIYISNVFPVAKYTDGTWPFKNTLVADIKKKTNRQDIVLMGYYTQKESAEQMRNSLISLSPKAQLNTIAMEYKGTSADAGKNSKNTDFWESGKTDKPIKGAAKKADDFWNN